jgi:hypothetical protein
MATHRFMVNIPNPGPGTATVDLALEPARPADVRRLGLEVPRGKLKVTHAGISRDPCKAGKPKLRLRLRAHESVDVYVNAETTAPGSAAGGTAVFNLVDRRGGRVAGGVMLACVDPALADPAGQAVPTPKPCPVDLAGNPYWVEPGEDPGKSAGSTLPANKELDLVVPLTNPRRGAIDDVTAYLEHLGGSDAPFLPAAWNIGTLRRGDVFYATWRVTTSGTLTGAFDLSVVVQSDGTDPTRLHPRIRISAPEEAPRARRRRRSARRR